MSSRRLAMHAGEAASEALREEGVATVYSIVIAALPLFGPRAFGQTYPTLPQAAVDTTMPVITGNTYTVNAGGDLQTSLNQSAAADTNKNHLIVLQAGAIFTGNFTFPARGAGTGYQIYFNEWGVKNNLSRQGFSFRWGRLIGWEYSNRL